MSDQGVEEISSARLIMRPMTTDVVVAIIEGRRLRNWACDFPSTGDREIAGLMARTGIPSGADVLYGHHSILERDTREVVGGVGFFGPPSTGSVEIGYGIVESRRLRGYATEAVIAMIREAFKRPGVDEVIATTTPDNLASIRVLEKAGMTFVRNIEGSEVVYAVARSR